MKTILSGIVATVDAFSIVVSKLETPDGIKYNTMLSFIVSQDDDQDEEILDLPLLSNIFADDAYTAIVNGYMVDSAFSQHCTDTVYIINEDGETIDKVSISFVMSNFTQQPASVH